jgi:beta-galactosidase
MCGEFWCGWFDQWGKSRNGSDSLAFTEDLRWMIDNDASFSLYMFHGGTSFGFSAGSNVYGTLAPTVTSYDYWACLDEAGRPTAKFDAVQKLLAPRADKPLPPLPAPTPLITIPRFSPNRVALLADNLPAAIHDVQPRPMEMYGQSHGLMVYRTEIGGLPPATLAVRDVHDYAHVSVNGSHVATLDRRLKQESVKLEQIPEGRATLEIIVDTLGRVNFGPELVDRKGITRYVALGEMTLMNWDVFPVPLHRAYIESLRFGPLANGDSANLEPQRGPAFYKATINLSTAGDTFLDMRQWGKGMVWVNGHNLGRYWSIGPQQTLFCPGCWLHAGQNDVVVFDMESAESTRSLAGVADPILNDVPAAVDRAH